MDPDEIYKLCDNLHIDQQEGLRIMLGHPTSSKGWKLVDKIIGCNPANKEGLRRHSTTQFDERNNDLVEIKIVFGTSESVFVIPLTHILKESGITETANKVTKCESKVTLRGDCFNKTMLKD
ncbi:Uncharacterized protein Fot_22509 [Forsythia ovata]|uniref:Uncharacterized protein n=1 Tax=Forsythia ovata TaxID=205694 RepID=A0ABD1UZV8_9LAMI